MVCYVDGAGSVYKALGQYSYLEDRLPVCVVLHHLHGPLEQGVVAGHGDPLMLEAPHAVLMQVLSTRGRTPRPLEGRVSLVL